MHGPRGCLSVRRVTDPPGAPSPGLCPSTRGANEERAKGNRKKEPKVKLGIRKSEHYGRADNVLPVCLATAECRVRRAATGRTPQPPRPPPWPAPLSLPTPLLLPLLPSHSSSLWPAEPWPQHCRSWCGPGKSKAHTLLRCSLPRRSHTSLHLGSRCWLHHTSWHRADGKP